MVYGKLQSIFKFFKGMSALDIVKYLFVGIPILILGFLYLFMAQGDIEKMFNEPLIVGQLLLVLAMPFCYLAMRNICQDLKDRKKRDGLLIPLWILIVYQVSSFNMICSFLIIYGTFLIICIFDINYFSSYWCTNTIWFNFYFFLPFIK